jgi:hypothetical protein
MKLNSLMRLPFLLLAGMVILFSCKKEEGVDLNTDRVIAEFTEAEGGGTVAMDFSSTPVEVDLTELRLFMRSWVKKGDVKVKVVNNAAVVGDYNTANGTNYTPLPASAYTFVSDEYTFTQDDRNQMVRIKLKPSDLLGGDYAIGLSISSVDNGDVSAVASRVMVAVSVKNKYDGISNVVGSLVDAAGTYTGIYPNDGVALRTAGADAVDYLDPTYSVGAPFFNNAYIIENMGTGAPAWLFSPRFVFNPTTNKAIAILDNDATLPGTIDPAGPNQFTINSPTSKQFVIKYTVLGGRFTITETWTYVGPR